MEAIMKIEDVNGVKAVSTRTVSEELGVQHKNLLETIEKYLSEIEDAFGRVAFKTEPLQTSGGIQNAKVAYLTEDQAIFVSTLSRNSQQVVQFKARLVQAFQAARKFIQQVTAPMNPAEMKLQVFRMLEEEAESLRKQNFLLSSAKELLEVENTELVTTVRQLEPKAEMFDAMHGSGDKITTDSIANELGISSAAKLNKMLEKDHIIKWNENDKKWVLTAKYRGQGLTIDNPRKITRGDGSVVTKLWMYWTGKGRIFLHQKYNPSTAVA